MGGKCHRAPGQSKTSPPDLRFHCDYPARRLIDRILLPACIDWSIYRNLLRLVFVGFIQAYMSITASTMAESWNWTPDSKLCFVTTGATAPFTALIESVLKPSSLDALREGGFTHLLVQYGSARDVYTKCSNDARAYRQDEETKRSLIIDGIDFNPDGLQAQFQLVQSSKGLVISHAGTKWKFHAKAVLADLPRIWLHPRSATISNPAHSRPQHRAARQPSGRARCCNGAQ